MPAIVRHQNNLSSGEASYLHEWPFSGYSNRARDIGGDPADTQVVFSADSKDTTHHLFCRTRVLFSSGTLAGVDSFWGLVNINMPRHCPACWQLTEFRSTF